MSQQSRDQTPHFEQRASSTQRTRTQMRSVRVAALLFAVYALVFSALGSAMLSYRAGRANKRNHYQRSRGRPLRRLTHLRAMPSARAQRVADLAARSGHAGGQRQDCARPLRRQHFQPRRRDLDLLQEGRQILGEHRREPTANWPILRSAIPSASFPCSSI